MFIYDQIASYCMFSTFGSVWFMKTHERMHQIEKKQERIFCGSLGLLSLTK